MLRPTLQRVFVQSIAFAALSLIISGNAFGQSSECAAEDYECYVRGYTAAISANPKNAEYYYSRGASYVKLKKFNEALQDYDKTVALNPKSNLGYIGRGDVYWRQDRYVEAVIELNKAIKIDPKDSHAIDLRRYYLDWVEKSDSAIDDYGKLIELEPDNAEYYNKRAQLQLKLKNYAAAVADSTKAIASRTDNSLAYHIRAIGNCQLGKRSEAMTDVARYRLLTGTTIKEICYIDIKFCDTTDDECRMKVFSEGIANPKEISPDAPNGLSNYYAGRGIISYEKGDFDLALSDFNHALSVYDRDYRISHPSIYDIHFRRGNIYLKKEKYDDALSDYEIAVRSITDSAELFSGIGQIYVIKRDYDKALPNLDRAIFLNPRSAAAYLSRGILYFERGRNFDEFDNDRARAFENYRQAVRDFDTVIETMLNTAPPETYLKRAKAYDKLGESEKAENDRAKYQELSEKP